MANTPNYDVDYTDERFGKVESDKNQALTELEQTYGDMIASSGKYFDDQIQASKDWADKQSQLQQDRTDFTIEQIEQQKEQANKDYLKEQSGAYVDWRKQSNQYGTEAEKMASAGLANTGFSESSQVSMYNTYQNRVATAREVFNQAVLNYNNSIKDAQLQNNAALAEIAYKSLQQQLELSLQGFQYKNQLILEQANKKTELDNIYYNRYQDVLEQINTENALAEEIRQFTENQKWQTDQNALDRALQEKLATLQREFDAKQAELNRKHDKEMLEAETKAEKERLAIEHKNAMDQLAQELANDKALATHEANLAKQNTVRASGGGYSMSSSSYNKKLTNDENKISNTSKSSSFTGSTYKEAVAYMKKNGVSGAKASAAMTESEWSRRRTAYKSTGQGATEVKNYSSYTAYIRDYVEYCISNK